MALKHEVKPGDCISSIAFDNGFAPETVWDHPENSALKALRKDPNVLLPGDTVFLPETRLKEVNETTNQVHKFRYKGLPAKLNLRVLDDGEPRAGEPFVLNIDGAITEGKTDSEGKIRVSIIPNAKRAQLSVGTADDKQEYELILGALPPNDMTSGIKRRLHNLGYKVGELNETKNAEFEGALREFEFDYGLEETGKISDINRNKIIEIYGC